MGDWDATDRDARRIVEGVWAVLRMGGRADDEELMVNTPVRVCAAWEELLEGVTQCPGEILSKRFDADSDELVVLRDVAFHSTCEHHLLPFSGMAHVAYLPGEGGQVVGLSKLARLVECFSRRLQLQERMTREIAEAMFEHLDARGAACFVEAQHLCMKCRGVRQGTAVMRTSSLLGVFREEAALRTELLGMMF